MRELLEACVKARLNILISGGTGSGKTTLLNVLSCYIPEDERIVTIEDAAELRLQQTHVARMETRPPNIEGTGAIRIRELVINALRMRPDRIIVGEVRGEEALDMLQAMNTGHDGSLTTVHANTPRDAVGRLEVMVGMGNANMGVRSIRQQVASAVDLFVQVARFSDGTRRVSHVTEVTGMEGDLVTLQDIFLFEKKGITEKGRVRGCFRATGITAQVLREAGILRASTAAKNISRLTRRFASRAVFLSSVSGTADLCVDVYRTGPEVLRVVAPTRDVSHAADRYGGTGQPKHYAFAGHGRRQTSTGRKLAGPTCTAEKARNPAPASRC